MNAYNRISKAQHIIVLKVLPEIWRQHICVVLYLAHVTRLRNDVTMRIRGYVMTLQYNYVSLTTCIRPCIHPCTHPGYVSRIHPAIKNPKYTTVTELQYK
jgi:hypothetical protein